MSSADSEIENLVALRTVKRALLRLHWLAAAAYFEIAMRRHHRVLNVAFKAGFNPDQPRAPRGSREGGRWTSGGSSGGQQATPTPGASNERPPKSRDRMAALKEAARRMLQTGETLASLAKVSSWLLTYSSAIESYNDPPRSLEELQRAVSTPIPGYDIHHIVEQTPAERDGFTRDIIDSSENLVLVPRLKHQAINAWYQMKNDDFGGETPREYLSGRNWEVRKAVGLEALKIHGVLKP